MTLSGCFGVYFNSILKNIKGTPESNTSDLDERVIQGGNLYWCTLYDVLRTKCVTICRLIIILIIAVMAFLNVMPIVLRVVFLSLGRTVEGPRLWLPYLVVVGISVVLCGLLLLLLHLIRKKTEKPNMVLCCRTNIGVEPHADDAKSKGSQWGSIVSIAPFIATYTCTPLYFSSSFSTVAFIWQLSCIKEIKQNISL